MQYSCGVSEFLLHLYFGECLEDVAYLYVVEVDDADTALEVHAHFLHVVLETLEGVDFAGVYHAYAPATVPTFEMW